jgi:hypothetical protein
MTNDDRDELYKKSFRQITYLILETANFEDSKMNQSANEMINKAGDLMDKYKEYKGVNQDQESYDSILKLNKISEKAEQLMNEKETLLKSEEILLENKRTELNSLRFVLKQSKFNNVYSLYQLMNTVVSTLKTSSTDSAVLADVLQEFESKVSLVYKEETQLSSNIKIIQKDFFFVKDLIETNEQVEKDFNLSKRKELIDDVNALSKNMKDLASSLKDNKKKLTSKLESLISIALGLMNQNDDYKKFKKILKESEKSVKKIQKLKFEHLKLKKDFNIKNFRADITIWKNFRMNPQDYFELEPKIYNLKELLLMINENLKEDDDLEQSVTVNYKSFYQHNTTRFNEIQEKYNEVLAQWKVTQELSSLNKEIDSKFGLVLAYLQGYLSPDPSFKKCFSTLELSVLLYYCNIFQLIVSKKSFMRSFLENIPQQDQLLTVKQVFKDLVEEPFKDNKMINFHTGEFAEDGLEQAVCNYDMLMNEEMDEFFKLQLSQKEQIKSKIITILSYAGIGIKFILEIVVKQGFKILFVTLASALALFITITCLPGILAVLIIGLVALIIKLVYNAIGNSIRNNPEMRYNFMKEISRFISKFTSKEIETLDYKEILNDNINENLKNKLALRKKVFESTPAKKTDRTQYFKQRFIEAIQMSVSSESIDFIDVYNGLM